MTRQRGVVATVAAVAAALPAVAAAGVTIPAVDTTSYPTVRLTVVTSVPTGARPSLRENGVAVGSVDALNLANGKSIVLAIDRSRSMADELGAATSAAAAFLRARAPSDRVAVVGFGRGAGILAPFATATADADHALAALEVDEREGTALYDALVLAAAQLRSAPPGGRVVVALTDGRDVSSAATLAATVAALRRADTVVFPVALGTGTAAAPLRALARETGGRTYTAASEDALPAIYEEVARDLGRTWRLAYATAARPGEQVRIAAATAQAGRAEATVTLPGRRAAAAPEPAFFGTAAGNLLVSLLAGAIALVVAERIAAFRRARRLRGWIGPPSEQRAPTPRRSLRERFGATGGILRATESVFGNLRQFRALGRALQRADMPLRPAELLYAMLGAAFLTAFVAAAAGAPGFIALLAAVAAGAAPYVVVARRGRRRLRRFEEQLPDVLMTISGSLRAGHSFRQGLQSVVEEGTDPARRELQRVLSESRLGRPVEESLADMAERLDSDNFRFVVSAVTIQRQVGGSLAGVFDMVADSVRERQQFTRRVKAATATGRMSAYTLVALPFGLGVMLTVINGDYMAPLYTTTAGHLLIGVAIVMMTIGWFVLRRIVAVED